MTTTLRVENVRVQFRVKSGLRSWLDKSTAASIDAVRDASFSLQKGETLALVGESGAGKSTLALAITGLERIAEGSIQFEGREVATMQSRELRKYRRNIGYMWQNAIGSLSPRMNVRSLITEPVKIHNVPNIDQRRLSNELLNLVGLSEEFGNRYPHQLSGGQARRVGVARALALNPQLIVADEPTAGLDVSVQGEILNLLNQLQDELKISMLVITHNLNVVRHTSDKIAIMYLGRIVEQGDTAEIFSKPRHPYTLALLSASPSPDPDMQAERIELKGEIPSPLNRPQGCEFHTRCPFVKDICTNTPPPFKVLSNSQALSCHFPR